MTIRSPDRAGAVADRLDFTLPAALEARQPPEARGLPRDGVRLLVSADGGRSIAHSTFAHLPEFLRAGDLLVLNDSATLPAALPAWRADGQPVRIHLSTAVPPGELGELAGDGPPAAESEWRIVEPREAPVQPGEYLSLPGGAGLHLLLPYRGSKRLWLARIDLGEAAATAALPLRTIQEERSDDGTTSPRLLRYLQRWGRPIAYSYVTGDWPIEAYQTIYAAAPGSAEMPSAGRPFSNRLFAVLRARGVQIVTLTLHTGVASLETGEPPYPEWFRVPASTADAVNQAGATGRRVIAVGTTVIRALVSARGASGRIWPATGWTERVVGPADRVDGIDGLITGLHEPRASHLDMLEAIAGRDHLARAYHAALRAGYLWHEFGDSHLIFNRSHQA